jgi:hypothetical protein
MLPALRSFAVESVVSVQKSPSRKTARANARAKRSRKRALARFKRAPHRPPKCQRENVDPIAPADFRAALEEPPAQYDIDAIERHVAQLAEQGLSSRLGPYAVAVATGLNELADPVGTQCEHETMETFADCYEVKFDKLICRVAQEFARLARIPVAEKDEFLLEVSQTLSIWIACVNWENDREFLDSLNETKRSAAALYQDLKNLTRYLNDPERTDSYASMYLMPSVIARMLRYLPAIIEGIHRMMPTDGRQGRPPGRKQYPGLADLVSNLEFAAEIFGGGFGIPNKKLKKGRLIQALNWLRAFLAGNKDWSWLAEFLPTPEQHPFSVYEGALISVYKLHITRTEAKPENRTEMKVENFDRAEMCRMRAMARSMRYLVDDV